MLFNSYEFIFIFLPIVLIGYYSIGSKSHSGAVVWLSFASLFFYAYWSLYSLPILVCSICLNYIFSIKLSDNQTKHRKLFLFTIIFCNLFLLSYFKYVNFIIFNINEMQKILNNNLIPIFDVALPIGISFFTFTQIAYLIDCYQGKIKERSFISYILFVCFFPHLIAGPLIHHKQLMPQFTDCRNFTLNTEKISLGLVIFTIGLAKKLLIADPLGEYADILFNGVKSSSFTPHFMMSWAGSFAYTFQLYFDFSGYSDMAVGLSLLFGIYLPINFDSPFKATNIINFWQRWHISLTKYIGEYLHTPLLLIMMRASNSKSFFIDFTYTTIFPTMFVFLVLGIWHGPNWNYIVFGLMHGIYVVINHLWKNAFPSNKSSTIMALSIRKLIGWLITFIAVNISFVMFRSDNLSSAFQIYAAMFNILEILNLNLLNGGLVNYIREMWQSQLDHGQSTTYSILLLTISFLIIILLPNISCFYNKSLLSKSILFKNPALPIATGILFVFSILSLNKSSAFLYYYF